MQAHLARFSALTREYSGLCGYLLVVALSAIFYFWQPADFPRHLLSDEPNDFYNELAQALLDGRVDLLRKPDPKLVALADPYNPQLNAEFRINDLSYYNGRYYLYMGPAPALDLFIPFRLISGRYLNENLALPLLSTIGFAASLTLIVRLRNRFLKDASWLVVASSMIAAALADGYYTTDRGTMPQQVAIAHAYACGMLALCALCFAVTSSRKRWLWFGSASLFFGFAVASRPNYVISSLSLLPAAVYFWRTRGTQAAKQYWKRIVSAMLPLAIVVSLLLLYNHARFGAFFDFGQRYLLGAWNQVALTTFGLNCARQNVWRYLLAPAHYHRFFPFVAPEAWIAVSVFPHVPWIWLTPAAICAYFSKNLPAPVRIAGLSALILAGFNLLLLVFLQSGNTATAATSANARYLVDFLPAWTLSVGLGAIAVSSKLSGKRILRAVWSLLAVSTSLASAVVALSLDLQQFPSEAYEPLSAVLDLPDYAAEKLLGRAYGPISIDLYFPQGATGAFDPIVSVGGPEFSQLLFVNYANEHDIRFGVVGTNFQVPLGPTIQVPDNRSVRMDISMGALFPPVGHPAASALSTAGLAYLHRHVQVKIDGKTVFDARIPSLDATPEEAVVGRSPYLVGYSRSRFSGTIAAWRRMPMVEPPEIKDEAQGYGPVWLSLSFPPNPDVGSREPLVCTGIPGAGDIAYVEYLPGGKLALGVDHWGGKGFRSAPVPVAPNSIHSLIISIGSLFPENFPGNDHAMISLDGVVLFEGVEDSFNSSPYDVTIGINAIGGSTTRYSFSGRILDKRRIPLQP